MRLSQQLLLLSLLTLIIPWAGYQHLLEMDKLLRQSQSQALETRSQALAARIAAEPQWLESLALAGQRAPGFYAPLSKPTIIVDGYQEDWRHTDPGLAYHFEEAGFSATLKLLTARAETEHFHNRHQRRLAEDTLYIFVEVSKAKLQYHHPGQEGLINGDHLMLRLGQQHYAVGSSSPGQVQARYQGSNGVAIEHLINGQWRENSQGYQLELQLPLKMAKEGFNLNIVAADDRWLGQDPWQSEPKALIHLDKGLDFALAEAQHTTDGKLGIVGTANQIISAHQAQSSNEAPYPKGSEQTQLHPFKAWIYQRLVAEQKLPKDTDWIQQGALFSPELTLALAGNTHSRWYQQGQEMLSRAASPIRNSHGRILGALVLEQNNNNHIALMNSALLRLLFYSGLASLLAGGGLLAYASWLSWRIRRLSRAADLALDEQGKLQQNPLHLPASHASDEVGDLSRSYHQLLLRLQAYTDYLRSLSSKLSHELRTPLAVVKTSLDNLHQQELDDEASIYAQRAQQGSERLSAILNAMGAASQVEAAIGGAEAEHFELGSLLQDLAAAYQDTFASRCHIRLDLQHDASYPMFGAPELLAQGLDKLLENAVDFCPQDGEIFIRLRRGQRCYYLEVDNDGPILPVAMQSQLFDSLVSIREPTKGTQPHLGLGLYIVQLIADYHQARVSARNREDLSGVIFQLELKITNFNASKT